MAEHATACSVAHSEQVVLESCSAIMIHCIRFGWSLDYLVISRRNVLVIAQCSHYLNEILY